MISKSLFEQPCSGQSRCGSNLASRVEVAERYLSFVDGITKARKRFTNSTSIYRIIGQCSKPKSSLNDSAKQRQRTLQKPTLYEAPSLMPVESVP